jgi:hypothetical protein
MVEAGRLPTRPLRETAVSIDGDGETPARAVAVLGFALASVLVDNPGDGYTSTPGVAFAGDGTGAAGTAVRAFEIASTAVTAAGAGYVTEPVVQATGGGGSDAQFQALIARALLRIDMAAAGSGYTSDPAVVITGDGSGATASFEVSASPRSQCQLAALATRWRQQSRFPYRPARTVGKRRLMPFSAAAPSLQLSSTTQDKAIWPLQFQP